MGNQGQGETRSGIAPSLIGLSQARSSQDLIGTPPVPIHGCPPETDTAGTEEDTCPGSVTRAQPFNHQWGRPDQDYPTLRYFRELRPVSRDFGKPASDRSVREALGALPLDPVCPPLYRRAGWRRGCGSAWSGHGWKDFLARTGTVAAITDMRFEHQGLGRESRSSPVLAASVCAGVWMGARAARGGPGPGVAGPRRRAGPGVRARAGP